MDIRVHSHDLILAPLCKDPVSKEGYLVRYCNQDSSIFAWLLFIHYLLAILSYQSLSPILPLLLRNTFPFHLHPRKDSSPKSVNKT